MPTPPGPDERDEPDVGAAEQLRDGLPILVATESRRRRDRQPARRGLGHRDRRDRKRWILRQDRPLQLPQMLSRLDPELLDQRPPRVLVGLERLGLALAAVEGEHQLPSEALAVGVLADQRLELTDQLRVLAERQLGIRQIFERRHSQILQAADLELDERLACEVGERGSPPERERRLERRDGALRPACCQLAPAFTHQPLEAVGVEPLRIERQLVAVLARDDHAIRAVAATSAERAPQP